MTVMFPYEAENPLKEEFFGHSRSGYFVDVGANDPERWSQSFHLEQMGWDGIVVEPQPHLAELLRHTEEVARAHGVALIDRGGDGSLLYGQCGYHR